MNYVNDPEKFKEASRNPYKAKTCDFKEAFKRNYSVFIFIALQHKY